MKEQGTQSSSLENYVAAAYTIARTIELISQKKVGTATVETWEILGGAMRFADDALDNTLDPQVRQKTAAEALSFLRDQKKDELFISNSGLQTYLPALKERIQNLPEARQAFFFRNLACLLKVTEQIRYTESVRRLSFLTRLEGQLTSRLYLSFLPQELNTSAIVQGVTRFGRIANCIDTAADLGRDFTKGEVKVAPTLRNRTFLLIDTFQDGLHAVQTIKPTLGFIGEALYKTHVTIAGRTKR